MANLRWAWSDRTRQSMTGWHPREKPADGEGRLVARVNAYSGGEWRADISRLGSRQPLTGTYRSADEAIAAVEAWLDGHPEHLAHPRPRRGKAARPNRTSD
jgi:hypothetical protein